MKPLLVYVAGPYRALTVAGITANINRARECAELLWKQGYHVFCPHLNSAHMDGLVPDKVFLAAGLEMLSRCDAIFVMPGSEHSHGTHAERALARERGIPEVTG